MKMVEKIKLWLTSAGIRSVGYLIAAVAAALLLGSTFLAGIGIGLFLSDNWITIKELINK